MLRKGKKEDQGKEEKRRHTISGYKTLVRRERMRTKEMRKTGKGHSLWIQMLKEDGKRTKERNKRGREEESNSTDPNVEK
jgi:hypothetical protein